MLFDAVTLGMDHISSTIANLREVATGTSMTIGCTHGFSHMWLQQRFSKNQDALPNHKVQIVTADHTNSLTLVDVTCAVQLGDGNWPDCDSKFLFSEQVFPVCTPEFAQQHVITDRDKLNPQKFQDLPLLMQDDGKNGWLGWPEWFSRHGITYQFEPDQKPINNYAFILQAAMEGKGIAMMWDNLDAPYLKRGWLIELGHMRVTTGNAYYLTFPKNSPFTQAVSKVFE